jgi:hypothetical protein
MNPLIAMRTRATRKPKVAMKAWIGEKGLPPGENHFLKCFALHLAN